MRAARMMLWPAARLWSLVARARVGLYRSGKWRQQRLGHPVVSVGNLSVGGTGKTPFVIWLFGALAERGLKAAVLTRGYRRPSPQDTLLFIRLDEAGARVGRAAGALSLEHSEADAGDEVQVMLRHGVVPIGVNANRLRAGRALEGQCAVDLYILDDGFQHLELARDLDIVLLDCSRLPWQDDLLPAGRLREPPSALRRAGVVVLTRVQDWMALEPMKAQLRRLTPQAEVFLARTRLTPGGDRHPCLSVSGQRSARGGESEPGPSRAVPLLSGTVLAFAGVGNPKAFFADLCVAGVQVVDTQPFPDHHRYTVRDLLWLEHRAREVGAEALVTTEKDAANLPRSFRAGLEMPLRVVGMELDVERGVELVERVEKLVQRSGLESAEKMVRK